MARPREKIGPRSLRRRSAALEELIEAGKVNPVMDRTYPLSETRQAMDHVGKEHAQGSVAITVSGSSSDVLAPEKTRRKGTVALPPVAETKGRRFRAQDSSTRLSR